VRLEDRNDRLTLLAFPRGRWSGRFGERGLLRSAEGRRSWRLDIAAERTMTYTVRAALTALEHPFRPARVTVGRTPLPASRWTYDARTGALTLSFRAPSRTTVRVEAADPQTTGRRRRDRTGAVTPRRHAGARTAAGGAIAAGDESPLPFTGLGVGAVAAAGLLLVAAGVAGRRLAGRARHGPGETRPPRT
jgi:hypothetical protein